MSTGTTIQPVPSVTEVDQIAALADPVIRNLQITQCYHELAQAMTARTGVCANWCTFATWASKQAGQTIRKEDLLRSLENVLFTAQAEQEILVSAQALGSRRSAAEIQSTIAVELNPVAAMNRAGAAVARGNQKVFEEIGREFARFYATCLHDQTFDAAKIADFCAALRPGEPPDGQQYLRQAFARYYQAFFESDPKTRVELLLLANIEIGFHEQTRLQPEIAAALNAFFIERRQFRERVIQQLFPRQGWLVRLRLLVWRLIGQRSRLDAALENLLLEAQRRARLIITQYLMTLTLPPDLCLRLGEDVLGEFPASLKHIVLPDLCTLLEKIDPTLDSTRDSGAVDWAELPHRLHFIVDLFRCYQEALDLFDAPFTAAQVAAFKTGCVPEGRL